jgi:deazaflavin-dependent oxidoreductase (nitroreductase family)
MPIPHAVTRFNKKYLNQVLVRLAGHGWFVELEHVGRRSGRTFRTPIMAFDRGDVVTIALTYGSGVDWLANLRAAGGGRMRLRDELLALGAPASLPEAEGRARMPQPPRLLLPLLGCRDYVEIPVQARAPFTGW